MFDSDQFSQEILKLYKMRKILSKAWIPFGISKEEAVDVLLWCVGEDVTTLHISKWPSRIKMKTGIKFDVDTAPVIDVFRAVAKEWRRRKPLVFSMN